MLQLKEKNPREERREISSPTLLNTPVQPTVNYANVNEASLQQVQPHITTETIMEELHEATRQYLSCADPTEAEARRQRVLIGDAKGEIEKAAASILAANTTHRQNIIISPILQQPGNNSQNPPVMNLLPAPESNFIPAEETQINTSNDAPRNEDNQLRRSGRQRIKPVRLRSVIVSPKTLRGASSKKRKFMEAQKSPARRESSPVNSQ
ncbi:hypothetical protein Bca52824_059335 [Brassica carinata]|uniref:Uncharacterized protein n=1 Tax=Brassica carinata TaxID=52824 RepID=A0A8X7UEL3_BRACI|nr:hypothetical protein Bca52824_059335 [Brassica carinata]